MVDLIGSIVYRLTFALRTGIVSAVCPVQVSDTARRMIDAIVLLNFKGKHFPSAGKYK